MVSNLSILKTLIYSDIFDFPLTKEEIWKFLISANIDRSSLTEFPPGRWEGGNMMWGHDSIKGMVNPPFFNSGYYHIYNRGVEKRNIFMNEWDYSRFMETLDFYRKSPQPQKLSDFRRGLIRLKEVKDQKELVKIFAYCLMPNHFHLLVQQLVDGGITAFVSNLANSYTRYFNTKHERIGALFQGEFKAKLIETDEYLLQVSKYIHRNPYSLWQWKNRAYPYSSYQYYQSLEQHPFCDISFILSYFSTTNPKLNYRSFVEGETNTDSKIVPLFIDGEEDE